MLAPPGLALEASKCQTRRGVYAPPESGQAAAAKKCGVTTVTVNRWASDPKYAHLNFPNLIPLGDNSVGLDEEKIDTWLEARAAQTEAA